jgi:hypothetical protein
MRQGLRPTGHGTGIRQGPLKEGDNYANKQ